MGCSSEKRVGVDYPEFTSGFVESEVKCGMGLVGEMV